MASLETGLQATSETPTMISMAKEQPRKSYCITRRFIAQIRGSIQIFESSGPVNTSWTCQNGKTNEIFGINDVFQTNPDYQTSQAMLQNAILHKVTILEQKSTFPISLGVTIGGINSEEVTKNGTRFATTIFPNTHTTQPLEVFCADSESTEAIQWRQNYPNYNAQNLETYGILPVNNQQYIFVHQDHPVIQVLRINRDLINADIDKQTRFDEQWFKVTKQVHSTCCQELRQRVLNKVSTRDLNKLNVQIHRLDKSEWTNQCQTDKDELLTGVPLDVIGRKDPLEINNCMQKLIEMPCYYMVRWEMTYTLNT